MIRVETQYVLDAGPQLTSEDECRNKLKQSKEAVEKAVGHCSCKTHPDHVSVIVMVGSMQRVHLSRRFANYCCENFRQEVERILLG